VELSGWGVAGTLGEVRQGGCMALPGAKCGVVAQLGERLVRNEEVSGSIPLNSTTLSLLQ
jgi:hypothetical protein